ncbi:hypothetical protein K9M41_00320 [Candidatus Gracilibacteria bacterium]|nr:hypothetical protein [Candidatus Gracilibacteria bacterium]
MRKILFNFSLLFLAFVLFGVVTTNAGRDTCSRHGGISYCGDNGRYICNDGTTDSVSVCGGQKSSYKPNFDYSLTPPKSKTCPSNSSYSYEASNCICKNGYKVSELGTSCVRQIKIPRNAHETEYGWECNEGYEKIHNWCWKKYVFSSPQKSLIGPRDRYFRSYRKRLYIPFHK